MYDMGTLTELSLFSGYGGFTLGLRVAGVATQTVCYVENDSYCQRIIAQRVADGYLDDAPIWDDVTTFDGRPWRGHVDIITGGFPCQPHSHAGKRLGKADHRNLWPDTCRIIRDVGPRYVILENVRGLADGANPFAAEVIGSLSEAGYDAEWGLYCAAEAGAPHLRWRWWCLAYSHADGERRLYRESEEYAAEGGDQPFGDVTPVGSKVPDTNDDRRTKRGRSTKQERQHETVGRGELTRSDGEARGVARWMELGSGGWAIESGLGRVAYGTPNRVDRIKTLGNGIVPAVVKEFLR